MVQISFLIIKIVLSAAFLMLFGYLVIRLGGFRNALEYLRQLIFEYDDE